MFENRMIKIFTCLNYNNEGLTPMETKFSKWSVMNDPEYQSSYFHLDKLQTVLNMYVKVTCLMAMFLVTLDEYMQW